MIPQVLSFITTYRCNFYCDHCSVSAGPSRREVLSAGMVREAIEQAYTLPSIRVVVFTGGEPTLYPDLLKKGIELAHRRGFVTRMVTNAWWAQTPEKAYHFLREFRAAGLDELNVSYDDFHAAHLKAFGGEQNVLNAVRAAADLGMNVVVGTVLYPGARIKSGYLREVFKNAGIREVKFLEDYVFPLGRARRKLPARLFPSDLEKREQGGCDEAGHTLTILPGGEVLFCCGHIINTRAQEILTVDSLVSGATLPKIVERMQRNVLFWWLHLEGPESVLTELGIDKKFYRRCEACFYLATACREKLRALAGRKEEIFARWEAKKVGLPA
ncbi:radical SAM protein [Desulfothermobacter acidiphilus]|uniref:radical SAM protein n=1 Tax=Desulfothermobacter acidiphilus TaxID=1938353 RepID=UPI003F8BE374